MEIVKEKLNVIEKEQIKITLNDENSVNITDDEIIYKISKYSIKDIIECYNSKKMLDEINMIPSDNKKILNVIDESGFFLALVFVQPIKVEYKKIFLDNKFTKLIDEKVYSSIQIDRTINTYNIKNPIMILKERKKNYHLNKYFLYQNLEEEQITIINSLIEFKYEENEERLNRKEFKPTSLSKYFNMYFKYPFQKVDLNSKDILNENFNYFNSENRSKLEYNLQVFRNSEKVNLFQIIGPSNDGKSTTLLYFSRISRNIVYLNIKTIINLYNNNKIEDYLNIIVYEFERVILTGNQKRDFEEIVNSNSNLNPWDIIEKLCYLLKNEKIVLIIDQFKKKYLCGFVFEKIKQIISYKFKIIISCSINDLDNGYEIIHSLYRNNGNPKELNEETQEQWFYYSNLVNENDFKKIFNGNDKINNDIYELFNYNPKYISLIQNIGINDIGIHILKKLESHSKRLGCDFSNYIVNIYSKINKKLNYDFNNLNTISLKYCILELGEKDFTIQYKFKYIQFLIEEKIKEIDIKDYFEKKKYNDKNIYSNIKGSYFENSCIKYIEKNKETLFPQPIKYNLIVDNIIDMKQSENEYEMNLIIENFNNIGKFEKINIQTLYSNYLENISQELKNEKDKNMDIEQENSINHFFYQGLNNEKEKINEFLKKKKNLEEKKRKSKKENIVEENINNITYNDDFKNSGILIKQRQNTGETLDLGVLYGDKNKKIFIGFQMKFYDEKTHIKNKIIKKEIQYKLNPLLINVFKNLGIKIKEWHYFLCLFFENEENYNKYWVNFCKRNNIEYIFYNPIQEKLLDKNFQEIIKFSLNYTTNIDFISTINPYNIFQDIEYLDEYLNQISFSSKINSNEIFNESEITIKKHFHKMTKKKLDFIYKFKLIRNNPFPIPKNSYLFIFKGNNKQIIFFYNLEDKLTVKCLNNFYDLFPAYMSSYLDSNSKNKDIYFYVYKINN